ncbi:MAG: hypothetical protein AAGE59_16610 [Cyanobacteria bacterium P01_F01_bin.86]
MSKTLKYTATGIVFAVLGMLIFITYQEATILEQAPQTVTESTHNSLD